MKVYVQMDYLQNIGIDYLSASYRDFVPEESALKRLIARHLKVAPSLKAQRIEEVERAIERKEKAIMRPIRKYIEKQIAAGVNATRSYFAHKMMRKQNWFVYWKVIEEGLQIEEEPEEEEAPEYDDTALSDIHKWLTKELQRAFSGWSIEEDYKPNEAEEFTATYKDRTFEFGLIRTARVDPDEVAGEETYYYIVYNSGAVQSYEMWGHFDYMGFNREMRRTGAWE